jgi:antirestriction protein ArdC
MAKLDVYDKVNDRIIESLENGVVPWQKPWKTEAPRNLNSKRRYTGLNSFLLALSPYASPFWCTFKGAKAAGGSVKKGEKGTMVIFWRMLEIDDAQSKTGKKKIPLLRAYTVFNAEQCENIKIPATKTREFTPCEEAQYVIDNMPNAPVIEYKGREAFYNHVEDSVTIPPQNTFTSEEGFYGTVFHELVHSTGHKDRLKRVEDWSAFGTDPYGKEELVAEMGASLLSAITGVTNEDANYENNAAYIKGWLNKLRQDKKLLVSAASQAQKAADYILGATAQDEEVDDD